MAKGKTKTGKGMRFVNMLILLVALVAAIVLMNLISNYMFGRVDLTDNNVNSLSPQTIEVVRSLVGQEGVSPIEVRLYISAELPETLKGNWGQAIILRGVDRKFRDKLEEYGSHVEEMFQIVEVTGDIEKKAEEAGVQPFVAEEAMVKEGKLEMTRYVLGCTFHYEGEVEVYPQALDPNFFEFEITKRLLRLRDRVENGRKVQHLIQASDEIFETLGKCSDEYTAFEIKEEEKQEVSGIEGLLKPIENMEEEVAALAKNRDRIAEACAPMGALHEEKGVPLKGEHKRFDAFIRGLGPEDKVGGVAGFVEVSKRLVETLAEESPNVQRVMELKNLLGALKEDAGSYRDLLKKAPGQQRIGFVCGHGEFCPFASDKPVIDPKIAGMMGQQNPIHQRFLNVAIGLQDQVNQILMGIGNGLFTDKDFDVTKVDASKTISDDVAALVVFGPREKYTDREMYEIDQFVLDGGTLLVFADNYDVSLASFSEEKIKEMGPFNPNPQISNDYYAVKDVNHNLDELLSAYGVILNGDLVLDGANNNKVTLPHSVRRGQMVIRGTKDFDYPMLVYAKEFDRNNVVVRNLPGLTLPYPSSLDYQEVEGQTVEVSHLIKSADTSISLPTPTLAVSKNEEGEDVGVKLLPPELTAQVEGLASNGPHTLAIMVTGEFVSAFKGKEAPPKPEPEPTPEGEPPPKEEKERERLDTGSGRILVVGSGLGIAPLTLETVFKDVGVQQITQGEIMVPQVRLENWKIKLNQLRRTFAETIPTLFNMLDWAVQRSALAEIRAKNYSFRPIETIEEADQKLVAYGAIGGLPLLFILFGLGYWQVRVARRRRFSRGPATVTAAPAKAAATPTPTAAPKPSVEEAEATTKDEKDIDA